MNKRSPFQIELLRLDLHVARSLVEHYLVAWLARPVKAKTAEQYFNRVQGQAILYKNRVILEESLNSAHLEQLCRRSFELRRRAWMLYRSALLYCMVDEYQRDGSLRDSADFVKTLAVLISITRPDPHQPCASRDDLAVDVAFLRKLFSLVEPLPDYPLRLLHFRPEARSISRVRIERMYARLAQLGDRGLQALRLMQATLATGARRGEWRGALLRPIDERDRSGTESVLPLMALELPVGKLKAGVPSRSRVLLITDPDALSAIEMHIANVRKRSSMQARSADPLEVWLGSCGTLIRQVADELFPGLKARITLRTFRSQARANFTAAHGPFVAAEMMGHSERVGRTSYARKQRALPRTSPLALPSADLLRRADEAREQRRLAGANRPWVRGQREEGASEHPSDDGISEPSSPSL